MQWAAAGQAASSCSLPAALLQPHKLRLQLNEILIHQTLLQNTSKAPQVAFTAANMQLHPLLHQLHPSTQSVN
jgi:hypothetical protein